LKNTTGKGWDEGFGSCEEILGSGGDDARERISLTTEELEDWTKINGYEIGFEECRKRERVDTARFIESFQCGECLRSGCEEERYLFHKYRDNREKSDEKEEENEKKYENDSEEIRDTSFFHPIEKRWEKDRQESCEKQDREDGGQEREEVESEGKDEDDEDPDDKNTDARGSKRIDRYCFFLIHNVGIKN